MLTFLALILSFARLGSPIEPPPADAAAGAPAASPQPPAEPAKPPAWDVATPPEGRTTTDVPINVDEGTWMTIDISPDGKTLVFDMLGDLYTLPIAGGDATPIATGMQWDMQPRFSPDGSMIAFVSDRTGPDGKGGDNLWIMRTPVAEARRAGEPGDAGGAPWQISHESFRLVTQPVWARDGQFVIGRKHFTSRRSLGAGEMWMYHISGKGDGLQLTAKATEQKDVGEPALSPDGRYLYYSLDAAPGSNFEYDRDSNTGIYAIDRLELQTGRSERFIAGPGGACRPVPSPDGKSIAFVRRVRYQTVLFVMDLDSRRARPVYEALERDNQETWAVHGVYPSFCWTPDSASMIFWAAGKIHRLDLASGAHSIIPFRVNSTRRISQAQRFQVEVQPQTFHARLLQNVSVSPAADRVAYQALGHIYVKDLPDGTPRRLTADDDNFEFFPSWSRDGSQIAFTTWNDDKLGAVRIADAATGASQPVTTEPGQYIDPVFSPDGAWIVYSKVTGGYLTSPLWSADPGIYAAPNPGRAPGIPHLISERGSNPQFGASGDHVYLTVREPDKDSDHVSLVSIPIDGVRPRDKEQVHYRSDWATEYRISPDGKWLAFAERYNVFVTPFLATGRTIDVGPNATSAMVTRVSKQAGNWLHWSGDSTTLHWSLGPDLYTQSVTEAIHAAGFAPPAPAPPTAAGSPAPTAPTAPEPAHADISFDRPSDVPIRPDGQRNCIALIGARIITMDGDGVASDGSKVRAGRVIENGAIVMVGNRIEAVGPAPDIAIPADADRWDVSGMTITPGFIDVHAHGSQGENGLTPQRNWIGHANLAFGVTTIHDPSNDTDAIFAASELARAGMILCPRTFSTGTILYGAAGSYRVEIESLDDAVFHLGRMKAVGAFTVKSYNQPRRDQRQMIIEAARRVGMMVVPEGGALFHHDLTMVVDGHTSVEHTLPVENVYNDVTSLWGASQTGYTPTLGVAYGGMGGENYWYARTNVWENEHLLHFVPRFVIDPRSRRRVDAPDGDWNHMKEAHVAKRILDAGGRPTLGAHGQLAGLAAHWETWMMVQGGMSPHEALRAATIDGAWYIGLDRDLGSISAGKLADLAIFKSNPDVDIRATDSISMVMLNGRLYAADDLRQVAPLQGQAPVMFFEDLQKGASTPLSLQAIMRHAAGCAGCGRAGCEAEARP